MAAKRAPQGSGPKVEATNPQARAPAYSDRMSQLEKDMAEIRDGMIEEVLEKLRRLSYEIEDINIMFDPFDPTGGTLDDFRVNVDRYKAETVNLRKRVDLGSAPSPPLNQQAGNDRFPIPICSGQRSILSRFVKLFYTWALFSKSEDALTHSRPVVMTTMKSRTEHEIEYGRQRSVEQSLVVGSTLTKAVEKDKTMTDIVVGAKAPSSTWKILKSVIDDDSSERTREQARKKSKV